MSLAKGPVVSLFAARLRGTLPAAHVAAMHQAATQRSGTHDFLRFQSTGTDVAHAVRTVTLAPIVMSMNVHRRRRPPRRRPAGDCGLRGRRHRLPATHGPALAGTLGGGWPLVAVLSQPGLLRARRTGALAGWTVPAHEASASVGKVNYGGTSVPPLSRGSATALHRIAGRGGLGELPRRRRSLRLASSSSPRTSPSSWTQRPLGRGGDCRASRGIAPASTRSRSWNGGAPGGGGLTLYALDRELEAGRGGARILMAPAEAVSGR